MVTPLVVPVSPVLLKAAEASWSAYASSCRFGGSDQERAFAYTNARAAERKVWMAEGAEAART